MPLVVQAVAPSVLAREGTGNRRALQNFNTIAGEGDSRGQQARDGSERQSCTLEQRTVEGGFFQGSKAMAGNASQGDPERGSIGCGQL